MLNDATIKAINEAITGQGAGHVKINGSAFYLVIAGQDVWLSSHPFGKPVQVARSPIGLMAKLGLAGIQIVTLAESTHQFTTIESAVASLIATAEKLAS